MARRQRSPEEEFARMEGRAAPLSQAKPLAIPSATSTESFPADPGYVYAMVNPVWPGLVKLGVAGSIKRRWFSYLTGDPYRAYRMLGWSDLLLDSREAERVLHTRLQAHRVDGSREWFRVTEAEALGAINSLRTVPWHGAAVGPSLADAPSDWYDDDF